MTAHAPLSAARHAALLTPPLLLTLPPVVPAGARERIIVGSQFAEVPLGLHLIRGENVVLLGRVDEARDPPQGLTQARRRRRPPRRRLYTSALPAGPRWDCSLPHPAAGATPGTYPPA